MHAIIVNYFTCFTLGSILIGESPISRDLLSQTWFPYAAFLSLAFIIFFNVNALTIQKVGMIITSIFQKLSLIFPVLVGLVFFNEAGSTAKYVAIPLTIVAIIMSNLRNKHDEEAMLTIKKYWYLPILVFAGSGLIEVMLFYVQHTGKVGSAGLNFTSTLFFLAGVWGIIILTVIRQLKFTKNEIIAGIVLGIPNFFTIYLIIKGLDLGWDGSVLFPINNIGVIFFTAIVGIIAFKEKLTKINYIGLLLAILAVYLISQ
ncbi:MAG: hypothetical protein KJN84_06230 [Bacteroidia bacterium]|nr:hypothetical protein [Bacteroidia bacterium]